MGGMMWVTGLPNQGPVRAGAAVSDTAAGLYAVIGILVALAERERSGEGQWVHTSLLEAQIALCDFQAARYLVDGVVPEQAGNDHPYSTPMGVVATADGYINLGVGGEAQWVNLCKALGRPELAKDPDYASNADRLRNRKALMQLLTDIMTTETSAHWLSLFERSSVPAGPIYRMNEVFADPQVQHLGIAQPVSDGEGNAIRLVGQPVTLSRTPASLVSPIPGKGAHSEAILLETGYSRDEIERLRALKVV
jgi:crotonobetainyl-CoA:carnitine CoA-transferase CaiB-like acyl-CoA transferase